MTSFTEPIAGPGPTGRTLDEVMNLAMKVGNPDPRCFNNTNRYVGCAIGTVHDTVTNLIWLKDANRFGPFDYAAANNAAAGLEDGECGLADGSSPSDWRSPTKEEWEATVAEAVAQGCTGPALMNTSGTACYSVGPQPFMFAGSHGMLITARRVATAFALPFWGFHDILCWVGDYAVRNSLELPGMGPRAISHQ